MTPQALEGYAAPDGDACPYLYSSANGIAWDIGRWMRATGRGTPTDVRMSRGFTAHVSGMLVRWCNSKIIVRIR